MKMSKWIGYAVSVNCGEPLGCYQGTILEADGSTITLTKAFRNGFPYPKSQVTLSAADIKDLKIIETKGEPPEQTHSTVAIPKKKAVKATVCENLQANPSSSDNAVLVNISVNTGKGARNTGSAPVQGAARSKPIDIQNTRGNKNNNHAGSYGNNTPKQRPHAAAGARRRNEACFGAAAAPPPHDFDFEGNLALFDKRALWEEMKHSQKPDVVRHADEIGGKFRHDENVLGAAPVTSRAVVTVPAPARLPADYVTDDGLLLPAVMTQLRAQFWRQAQRYNLLDSFITLLGRACADVCVRLAGGGRRLDARNAHQRPAAAVLAGRHAAGAAALCAARLLSGHGAHVTVLVAGEPCSDPLVERELAALQLDGITPCSSLHELPRADLVLWALHDPLQCQQSTHAAEVEWAAGSRGAVVCVEACDVLAARACVQAGLPGAPPPARLYLANVAPPRALWRRLGVEYRTPFGAASVLALHQAMQDD